MAIVEDVVTAGTAVRESIELFKHVADVNIKALFVSVDRMERGTRECSTLDELRQDYGIQVFPIVTVREVISFLHNNPIDGKVYIDDEMKAKMEAYLEEYGAKAESHAPPSPRSAEGPLWEPPAFWKERDRSHGRSLETPPHRSPAAAEGGISGPGPGGLAGPQGPGTAFVLCHPSGGM